MDTINQVVELSTKQKEALTTLVSSEFNLTKKASLALVSKYGESVVETLQKKVSALETKINRLVAVATNEKSTLYTVNVYRVLEIADSLYSKEELFFKSEESHKWDSMTRGGYSYKNDTLKNGVNKLFHDGTPYDNTPMSLLESIVFYALNYGKFPTMQVRLTNGDILDFAKK